MTHNFHELVIGGVLFAPFVTFAVAALAIILALRPILHVIGFAKIRPGRCSLGSRHTRCSASIAR